MHQKREFWRFTMFVNTFKSFDTVYHVFIGRNIPILLVCQVVK